MREVALWVYLMAFSCAKSQNVLLPSNSMESSVSFRTGFIETIAAVRNGVFSVIINQFPSDNYTNVAKYITTDNIGSCAVFCAANLEDGCNVYTVIEGECIIGMADIDAISSSQGLAQVEVRFATSTSLRSLMAVVPTGSLCQAD